MKRLLLHSRAANFIYCFALIFGLGLAAGPAQSDIVDMEVTALGDDIVHYAFEIDLGPGDFDTIRLHRVVKELEPGQPVDTVSGMFMLPGSPNYFDAIFLASSITDALPAGHSVAEYLARNDIDVWGMDYAWALVPRETSEFDFMEGWGLETDIGHAEQALQIIRSIRADTGQGKPRMHVLGFSYGVPIAYAIAGNETQRPPGRRLVNGIISVDSDLKLIDETERLASCVGAANGRARVAAGNYVNKSGFNLNMVGSLAKWFPDDPTPLPPFAGLTNWQTALILGAMDSPFWHFVGGVFNEYGIPTGLSFSEPDALVDLFINVPPYSPRQTSIDINTARCDEVDVPFDDHLEDIVVPILAVGAAGGAAPQAYTPSLTASRDVSEFTVQFLPDEQHALDFGHADLFIGNDADVQVWQPILDWVLDHRSGRTYP